MTARSLLRAARAVPVAMALAAAAAAPALDAQPVTASALKAAFLLNFTQFVEWTADVVQPNAPVVVCVVGDNAVAEALESTARGRAVTGHEISVRRLHSDGAIRSCQVLFVGTVEPRFSEVITGLKGATVFTVSDRERFANEGGMVELFLENGRMRFAVNVDALQRAHVRLSSRVLGLARIVRDGNVQ